MEILYQTPDNPVPENHVAGHFRAFDGCRLRYAIFRAATPVAKGTVVLLHGRNETIEKYYETIGDLTRMGLWVATFDSRGQGGSDRLIKRRDRGHIHRFDDHLRDLDTFLRDIVLPDTRLPFFILAHSSGALVALAAAPRLARKIDRMVLAAPFIDLTGQRFSRSTIGFVTRAVSLAGLGRMTLYAKPAAPSFEGNPLTSDRRRFKRNNAITETVDALYLGPPTARWLSEMNRAVNRVNRMEFLTRITIPTLVLMAGRDTLVASSSMEAFSHRFRAARLIAIDGARHELLQEADYYREQALAAIEAFLPGKDNLFIQATLQGA